MTAVFRKKESGRGIMVHTDLASCIISLDLVEGWGYVHNVLTAHWARGEGHGSDLMRQVGDWATERGLTLFLECRPALVDWYARFGFVLGTLPTGPLGQGFEVLVRPALTGMTMPGRMPA